MNFNQNQNTKSRYVISPVMPVSKEGAALHCGYEQIASKLSQSLSAEKNIVVIECYPGLDQGELLSGIEGIGFDLVINSDELAFEAEKLDAILAPEMTNDRVFGSMTTKRLRDFFYEEKLLKAAEAISSVKSGNVLVYGVGASLITDGDILIVVDITRWEDRKSVV